MVSAMDYGYYQARTWWDPVFWYFLLQFLRVALYVIDVPLKLIFNYSLLDGSKQEIIQAKEMEIFSDEKIIHLDGETKTIHKNVFIQNNPKTLKILIPNG